ncbi:hypothetical protein PGTUg99_004279 [Puccinia graminis f. sp. tritici]|uniref:Uncharacterized protein n=1 Tax=Puccinia graminis f. sp. tritici TaxID=56615 RepID=A0A5B0PF99_PUCGR|nr:hypothetical protein PGTUg99_004279 [Puccinia graminis f. sp. tritici]
MIFHFSAVVRHDVGIAAPTGGHLSGHAWPGHISAIHSNGHPGLPLDPPDVEDKLRSQNHPPDRFLPVKLTVRARLSQAGLPLDLCCGVDPGGVRSRQTDAKNGVELPPDAARGVVRDVMTYHSDSTTATELHFCCLLSENQPTPTRFVQITAQFIRTPLEGSPQSTIPSTNCLPPGTIGVPQRLEGFPSSRRGTSTSSTGRASFQPTRYKYLIDWKGFLPADEVQVPHRLEGLPSSRRGTSTSSTGRASFQPTRYKYLIDWKGFLPANEVQVPRRLEGLPSSRRGTCTLLTGRTPFQPARYMYLVDWKGLVHVPRQLKGCPSSRQGTSTSPAGRKPFQPVRCRPFRGRVSEDTRCGRRIPASGCGCGCGCAISLKSPSDIWMRTDHL